MNRALVLGLLLIMASPVAAQPAVVGAADVDILPEVIAVYSDGGPAWWKVTKGDSTVFILGLPPTATPRRLEWDRRTLQRRLKGARLVLMQRNESLNAPPRPPGAPRAKTAVLPPEIATRVIKAANALGGGMRDEEIVRADDALRLRVRYFTFHDYTNDARDEIFAEVKRAKIPIVSMPTMQHYSTEKTGSLEYAEARACYDDMLKRVETPIADVEAAGKYWAVGDVPRALASAVPDYTYSCRGFWGSYWERQVGFQTNAIAQSLQKPGKVIVLAHIPLLAGRNGILARLRAQGFTIADPAKPLTD